MTDCVSPELLQTHDRVVKSWQLALHKCPVMLAMEPQSIPEHKLSEGPSGSLQRSTYQTPGQVRALVCNYHEEACQNSQRLTLARRKDSDLRRSPAEAVMFPASCHGSCANHQ